MPAQDLTAARVTDIWLAQGITPVQPGLLCTGPCTCSLQQHHCSQVLGCKRLALGSAGARSLQQQRLQGLREACCSCIPVGRLHLTNTCRQHHRFRAVAQSMSQCQMLRCLEAALDVPCSRPLTTPEGSGSQAGCQRGTKLWDYKPESTNILTCMQRHTPHKIVLAEQRPQHTAVHVTLVCNAEPGSG
jgi:hypothetical protein